MKYLDKNKDCEYSKTGLKCEPMTIEEIEDLEHNYNSGNMFPIGLREFLYLAGKYCYVIDTSPSDTQIELQQEARDLMEENDVHINRPFFCVDTVGGFGNDEFMFVYGDDSRDDPSCFAFQLVDGHVRDLGLTLNELIKIGIENIKKGLSPF